MGIKVYGMSSCRNKLTRIREASSASYVDGLLAPSRLATITM